MIIRYREVPSDAWVLCICEICGEPVYDFEAFVGSPDDAVHLICEELFGFHA